MGGIPKRPNLEKTPLSKLTTIYVTLFAMLFTLILAIATLSALKNRWILPEDLFSKKEAVKPRMDGDGSHFLEEEILEEFQDLMDQDLLEDEYASE